MALNTKKVEAIIFDLDNTLIPTKEADDEAYELVREVIEEACPGYDTAAMTSKFRVDLGWNEGCDPDGRLTVDEWRTKLWETTLNEHGVTQYNGLPAKMYATWKKERLKRMVFTEEIKKMLVELRKDYKLQLMTNGPLEPQREKSQVCESNVYFDSIVLCGLYAEQKPYPSVYRRALQELQVDAERCVMVGDRLNTDIQGGLNAKLLSTVWINPTGAAIPEGGPVPHHTVKSVLELPKILDIVNGTPPVSA
ncbi:N-acylneuraminate-9-phosphatase-like [Branchiostoma lanceolatum]|uniref:N-acylneuraminate-9-phosphatase-like n=1 Tax=Branchiostoma lanceolatum TaxID=7740 RepID=UPI0034540986